MRKKVVTDRMAELAVLRKEKRKKKRGGGKDDRALLLRQAIGEADPKPFTREDARRVLRPKKKKGGRQDVQQDRGDTDKAGPQ